MKLDVGSGTKQASGYSTVDQYCDADYKYNISELDLHFEEFSVEEIRSSHSLEHLKREDVLKALKGWFKILKHNGLCWIDVPDMAKVGRLLVEAEQRNDTKKRDWYLTVMYGLQTHPGEFHTVGFTMSFLVEKMKEAGFIIVDTAHKDSHGAPAIQVLGKKP